MAVCALTMLDGMEDEVTAAGGVLLLALALVLAWLSTHVADRGDHILGTILTVGAHASLIGLGGHDGYGGAPASADAPEQQAAPPSQENKPDDGGGGRENNTAERGESEGSGEGAEGVWSDLLLDIQSKQPPTRQPPGGEDDDLEEEEEDEGEEPEAVKPGVATPISVRLKFLNDSEEVAVVELQDTVAALKRKCFSGREQSVKLIYRGQLLQDPRRTLRSLNVTHNSVIHCHVAPPPREAGPEEGGPAAAAAAPGGLRAAGTGSMVVPVFVVILAVVWYFRINYRQFFTAPATVSLVGVTVFFSFLVFGMHSR